MSLKRRLGSALLLAALSVPALTTSAYASPMQAAAEGGPKCANGNCGTVVKTPKKAPEVKFSLSPGAVEVYDSQSKLVRSTPLQAGGYVRERIGCDQTGFIRLGKGNLDSVQYNVPSRHNDATVIGVAKDKIFTPDELRAAGGSVAAHYDVRGFKGKEQKASYAASVSFTLDDCVTPQPEVRIENNMTIKVNEEPRPVEQTPDTTTEKKTPPDNDKTTPGPYGRSYGEALILFGKGMQNFEGTDLNGVRIPPASHDINQVRIGYTWRNPSTKIAVKYAGTLGSDKLPTGIWSSMFSNNVGAQSVGLFTWASNLLMMCMRRGK